MDKELLDIAKSLKHIWNITYSVEILVQMDQKIICYKDVKHTSHPVLCQYIFIIQYYCAENDQYEYEKNIRAKSLSRLPCSTMAIKSSPDEVCTLEHSSNWEQACFSLGSQVLKRAKYTNEELPPCTDEEFKAICATTRSRKRLVKSKSWESI